MYPLDRRYLASHIYSLLRSLRKVALVLKVSHTTVSRWLIHPTRIKYTRRCVSKSSQIVETIKTAIFNDPFISLIKLKTVVKNVFSFDVSKELLRIAIKRAGLTRKRDFSAALQHWKPRQGNSLSKEKSINKRVIRSYRWTKHRSVVTEGSYTGIRRGANN